MIDTSTGNNRRGMARILNYNLFITTESHPYSLTIFRFRDLNNKDFKILDY